MEKWWLLFILNIKKEKNKGVINIVNNKLMLNIIFITPLRC
jgi:hypothetical protein